MVKKIRGWYKIVLGAALSRWWWCFLLSIIIIIKVLSPVLVGAHLPPPPWIQIRVWDHDLHHYNTLTSSLENIISLPWKSNRYHHYLDHEIPIVFFTILISFFSFFLLFYFLFSLTLSSLLLFFHLFVSHTLSLSLSILYLPHPLHLLLMVLFLI